MARALAQSLACPSIELDAIYHQPGWTELGDEEFRRRVAVATEGPSWVVDGNYSVVRDITWSKADTVVWFDLAFATVMSRTVRRTVRRVITREELWNGNREPWSNVWSIDPQRSIIAWTATRHRLYRERYRAAENDARWSTVDFIRLGSPAAVGRFLRGVSPTSPEGGVT
jgi:adenylate kinase family enzyme